MASARTQPSVAPIKTSIPMNSGFLRPHKSLSGPARICPSAIPSVVIVSVIWMRDVDTPKSACTSGSAGRYISVESGAIAVMIPKNNVSQSRLRSVVATLFPLPP